jgi:hypothetical protein
MRTAACNAAGDWELLMRGGDFAAAWRVCDRVLRERRGTPCDTLPRHLQWVWDGSPLDGRDVLVRCYHGLGDTIQFARYLPLLRARAARLTAWVQPALLPLIQSMNTCDAVLPLHDGAPAVEYEIDVEIMELPHVFRTTVATLPNRVPYLHVTPLPLRRPFRRPAVGLVWSAGSWNALRSIPPALLAPLFELDVEWYALQGGVTTHDLATIPATSIGRDDIVEAARAMRSLDLVITVDSMPAHLAGALGVPVWTLLPCEADWRWMNERDDSPWYPTMRLFRQERPHDWQDVIARVRHALVEMTHGSAAAPVPFQVTARSGR